MGSRIKKVQSSVLTAEVHYNIIGRNSDYGGAVARVFYDLIQIFDLGNATSASLALKGGGPPKVVEGLKIQFNDK